MLLAVPVPLVVPVLLAAPLPGLADWVLAVSACINNCMKLCRSLASCAGDGPVLAAVLVPLAVLDVELPVADVELVLAVLEAICCCRVSNSAPTKPPEVASVLLADGVPQLPLAWLCPLPVAPWVAVVLCAAAVLEEAKI